MKMQVFTKTLTTLRKKMKEARLKMSTKLILLMMGKKNRKQPRKKKLKKKDSAAVQMKRKFFKLNHLKMIPYLKIVRTHLIVCRLAIRKVVLGLTKRLTSTTLKIGLDFLQISIIVYFNIKELVLAGSIIFTSKRWEAC